MAMSDDPNAKLEQAAAQSRLAQIAAQLRALPPVVLDEPVVDVLREARDHR